MNNHSDAANAAFVEELTRFHSLRGTTLKIPKFNRSPLDLEKLWHAVRKNGGSSKVCEMKHWAQIGRIFGGTSADKNVSNNIKRAFTKWLLPYERAFFPEDAMSSNGEHSVSSTPRRKRQPIPTPGSNEKKSRSSSFEEKKETGTEIPMDVGSLPPVVSSAPTSMALGALPPTQRSYVSIPHSTESKICIILLPNTAAPDLNGIPGSAPQLQMPSQHMAEPSPNNLPIMGPAANGHVNPSIRDNREGSMTMTSPLPADQFTLSLLMNHNEGLPSEANVQLPNVSVLIKQDTQNPSTESAALPASRPQEPSDERRSSDEAAAMSNIPCSGLLCLLDSGIPTHQPSVETNAMITPKSS